MEVLEMWNDLWTGDATLNPRGEELAQHANHGPKKKIRRLGWDFHTVRGGINPGDIRVRPRVVGVVVCGWIPIPACDPIVPG